MVIGGKACCFQLPRLLGGQHSERAADFQLKGPNTTHHLEHLLELGALGRLAPGSSHTKPRCPISLRALGGVDRFPDRPKALAREAGFVMGALRAVGAVLRASARLDRKQPAELHLDRRVKFAVNTLRPEHE